MPPKKPSRPRKKSAQKTSVVNPWAEIDIQRILKTLEQSILGEGTLTPAQVTVALALLKKALPDLPEKEEAPGLSHEDALRELDDPA